MARKTNGSLYVDVFTPTENEGEYTFENALFSNQADTTGNGAYDIQVGFILHIPATDMNTFMLIPGCISRYKLTNLTYVDNVTISGTVIWDMGLPITDIPTNGIFCMISDTTDINKIAIPPIDTLYPDIMIGSTISAVLNDMVNIIDKLGGGSSPTNKNTVQLTVENNGQLIFNLPHVPTDKTNTIVLINGLIYAYGMNNDYTIDTNILTWTDVSLVLDVTDNMVVSYTY